MACLVATGGRVFEIVYMATMRLCGCDSSGLAVGAVAGGRDYSDRNEASGKSPCGLRSFRLYLLEFDVLRLPKPVREALGGY